MSLNRPRDLAKRNIASRRPCRRRPPSRRLERHSKNSTSLGPVGLRQP